MPQGFVVRPGTPADAGAIAAIYAQVLYDGCYTKAEVETEMRRRQGVFFVAEADGQTIGAGNATWASPRSTLDAANIGTRAAQRRILAAASGAGRIGSLDNVGVLPSWRGRGVARALVDARLRWLQSQGVGFVYSWGWKSPEGCHIEKTLRSAGLQALAEVPDFYLQDGLAKAYSCPYCGPICHCSAILFTTPLALEQTP